MAMHFPIIFALITD